MEPRNIVFLVVVALLVAFVSAKHQPKCGDGVTQSYYYNPLLKQYVTEECDDGNKRDNDGCSHLCQNEVCGDGIVQTNEECDGEPLCDMYVEHVLVNCKWMRCGDGFVQAANGEECDGGNAVSGDGCSDVCKIEFCGDGVLQLGLVVEGTELIDPLYEQCDDGNTDNGDGCNMFCQLEYCGDGIVQPELGEMCDLGAQNLDPAAFEFFPYAWCNPQCQCIGFDTWFNEGYATALQTCPGADNYPEMDGAEGYLCSFPAYPENSDVLAYVITPQTPLSLTAYSNPMADGSPFYGKWDVDLQGAFSIYDYQAQVGTFFKFRTTEIGVVHATTNLPANELEEINPYFLEVYEQPCAAPTNYIASSMGPLFTDIESGIAAADLFFFAKADKDYYLFAGVSGMYGVPTSEIEFTVSLSMVPFTEVQIPTDDEPYTYVSTVFESYHDGTEYAASSYFYTFEGEEFPLLMLGRWYHFVVPDFGQGLGSPVCIGLTTWVDEGADYSFISVYDGGYNNGMTFASDDLPTALLKGHWDGTEPITTTIGTDWWVLVQIPGPGVYDEYTCTPSIDDCEDANPFNDHDFPIHTVFEVGRAFSVALEGGKAGACGTPK